MLIFSCTSKYTILFVTIRIHKKICLLDMLTFSLSPVVLPPPPVVTFLVFSLFPVAPDRPLSFTFPFLAAPPLPTGPLALRLAALLLLPRSAPTDSVFLGPRTGRTLGNESCPPPTVEVADVGADQTSGSLGGGAGHTSGSLVGSS